MGELGQHPGTHVQPVRPGQRRPCDHTFVGQRLPLSPDQAQWYMRPANAGSARGSVTGLGGRQAGRQAGRVRGGGRHARPLAQRWEVGVPHPAAAPPAPARHPRVPPTCQRAVVGPPRLHKLCRGEVAEQRRRALRVGIHLRQAGGGREAGRGGGGRAKGSARVSGQSLIRFWCDGVYVMQRTGRQADCCTSFFRCRPAQQSLPSTPRCCTRSLHLRARRTARRRAVAVQESFAACLRQAHLARAGTAMGAGGVAAHSMGSAHGTTTRVDQCTSEVAFCVHAAPWPRKIMGSSNRCLHRRLQTMRRATSPCIGPLPLQLCRKGGKRTAATLGCAILAPTCSKSVLKALPAQRHTTSMPAGVGRMRNVPVLTARRQAGTRGGGAGGVATAASSTRRRVQCTRLPVGERHCHTAH